MGPGRLALALPLGLMVASLAHRVRFGHEHEFGEGHHDWVTSGLRVGLALIAWALVARTAYALERCSNGALLADRLAELLPGRAEPRRLSATIAFAASSIYVGIERLEVHGDRTYWFALIVISILSIAAALAIRRILAFIAHATIAIFRLSREPRSSGGRPHFLRRRRSHAPSHRASARIRLGRAPPISV
jgi:hypothetical protein